MIDHEANTAMGQQGAVLNQLALQNQGRDVSLERHYSVQEVAKLWGISRQTVTRLFAGEPGILPIGHGETRRKRAYYMLKIPESVLIRVHRKLQHCFAPAPLRSYQGLSTSGTWLTAAPSPNPPQRGEHEQH
jgi:hypothetical protein